MNVMCTADSFCCLCIILAYCSDFHIDLELCDVFYRETEVCFVDKKAVCTHHNRELCKVIFL